MFVFDYFFHSLFVFDQFLLSRRALFCFYHLKKNFSKLSGVERATADFHHNKFHSSPNDCRTLSKRRVTSVPEHNARRCGVALSAWSASLLIWIRRGARTLLRSRRPAIRASGHIRNSCDVLPHLVRQLFTLRRRETICSSTNVPRLNFMPNFSPL